MTEREAVNILNKKIHFDNWQYCPSCGNVAGEYGFGEYCEHCGQRLEG